MSDFNASFFEITQISSTVNVNNTAAFFKKQGIFYSANADIQRAVKTTDISALRHPAALKDLEFNDPVSTGRVTATLCTDSSQRVARILESYEPFETYLLGSRRGAFFAFSVKESSDCQNYAIVYTWTKEKSLEFFPKSHEVL